MKRMMCMLGVLLTGALLTAMERYDPSWSFELFMMKATQNRIVRLTTEGSVPGDRFSLSAAERLTLRPSRDTGTTSMALDPRQLVLRLQLVSEKMVIDPAVGLPDSMYAGGDAAGSKASAAPQKPDLNRMRLQLGLTADKMIIDPAVGLPESFYQEKASATPPEKGGRQGAGGDPQREGVKNSGLDRVANRWGDAAGDAQYQGCAAQGPKSTGVVRDDMGRTRATPSQKAAAMDDLMRDLRGRSLRGNAEQPNPYGDL